MGLRYQVEYVVGDQEDGPARLHATIIPHQIQGHAISPGGKIAIRLKRAELAPESYASLLKHLIGIGRLGQQRTDVLPDPIVVATQVAQKFVIGVVCRIRHWRTLIGGRHPRTCKWRVVSDVFTYSSVVHSPPKPAGENGIFFRRLIHSFQFGN